MHFADEALAHAGIRPVFIALPTSQQGAGDAVETRAVQLEIAPEGPIEKAFRVVSRDRRMLEVEFELAVNIGEVNIAQEAAFFGHLLIKRSTRNRRVEHELVEVGVVGDGVLDFGDDVVWGVMLESDNGRALYADSGLA